jgi:Cellulose biosynthesis protein BcsS
MISHKTFLYPLLATLIALPAGAQEVVTGFEGGPSSGMAFVSPVFSNPLGTSSAFVIRPTASYLYYEKRNALGETKITAPGASLGLGYRYSDGRFMLAVGPAFEVLWERRKNLLGPDTKDTLVGVMFAGDLSYQATPVTNVNLSASYDQTNQYYWSRAGVKQQVTDLQFDKSWALLLGAEVTGQGDKDVQQLGGGGVVEFAFDKGQTGFQIRGGYSWLSFADHSREARPYLGTGLYHRF